MASQRCPRLRRLCPLPRRGALRPPGNRRGGRPRRRRQDHAHVDARIRVPRRAGAAHRRRRLERAPLPVGSPARHGARRVAQSRFPRLHASGVAPPRAQGLHRRSRGCAVRHRRGDGRGNARGRRPDRRAHMGSDRRRRGRGTRYRTRHGLRRERRRRGDDPLLALVDGWRAFLLRRRPPLGARTPHRVGRTPSRPRRRRARLGGGPASLTATLRRPALRHSRSSGSPIPGGQRATA